MFVIDKLLSIARFIFWFFEPWKLLHEAYIQPYVWLELEFATIYNFSLTISEQKGLHWLSQN